jgi:hypothetical protein
MGGDSWAGFFAFVSNSSTVGLVFSVESKAISPASEDSDGLMF